jgi:hypothetical protein
LIIRRTCIASAKSTKNFIQFAVWAEPTLHFCLAAKISANRQEWPLPLLRIVKLRGSKLSSALTMEAADCALGPLSAPILGSNRLINADIWSTIFASTCASMVHTSNGNASETKANESFDSGVFFDIEAKRIPSIVSKLFSKRSEHVRYQDNCFLSESEHVRQ